MAHGDTILRSAVTVLRILSVRVICTDWRPSKIRVSRGPGTNLCLVRAFHLTASWSRFERYHRSGATVRSNRHCRHLRLTHADQEPQLARIWRHALDREKYDYTHASPVGTAPATTSARAFACARALAAVITLWCRSGLDPRPYPRSTAHVVSAAASNHLMTSASPQFPDADPASRLFNPRPAISAHPSGHDRPCDRAW